MSDVVDLRAFYTSSLGMVARRMVNRAIRAHWAGARGMTVVGLGYCTPYLGLFREDADRSLAFMPARQGVIHWPTARPGRSALVEDDMLPLPDAAVDRMLIVHALEMSDDVGSLLGEVWRVLAAGGRVLAVVPNRRGLWAQRDTTPFGQGRPYSSRQLTELMRQSSFTPVAWSQALWVPPIRESVVLRSAAAWERVGSALSLPFAGVHLVEATKQVYKPAAVRRERAVEIFRPSLAPSPATRIAQDT
ncbi:class I SAM-dependent methyltransferase [Phreatobacter aquaticus]|uniref:Class I SAM-dependent methyltransferase n=1 Tax=Phreatobacter aquaticus TaxID=2570229 RepID=A0A4D7QDV8_9HYPH|nr:methyltransferase domain-containing protein [Phreatobacter aquaticus]QCK84885.1 class I SAM-dependent methyltransferase [Phreatobacter aquaticus]